MCGRRWCTDTKPNVSGSSVESGTSSNLCNVLVDEPPEQNLNEKVQWKTCTTLPVCSHFLSAPELGNFLPFMMSNHHTQMVAVLMQLCVILQPNWTEAWTDEILGLTKVQSSLSPWDNDTQLWHNCCSLGFCFDVSTAVQLVVLHLWPQERKHIRLLTAVPLLCLIEVTHQWRSRTSCLVWIRSVSLINEDDLVWFVKPRRHSHIIHFHMIHFRSSPQPGSSLMSSGFSVNSRDSWIICRAKVWANVAGYALRGRSWLSWIPSYRDESAGLRQRCCRSMMTLARMMTRTTSWLVQAQENKGWAKPFHRCYVWICLFHS